MKKLLIIVILIVGVIGITFAVKPKATSSPNLPGQEAKKLPGPIIFQDYVTYEGKDGKTALQLLESATPIQTKQFDFGVLVEGINGIRPDQDHFWKLYINGQESSLGADQLQTKNGDIIEWKLEAIR